MRTVYKYVLKDRTTQKVAMPGLEKIVHVGMQNDTICLWAEVQTHFPEKEHTIFVVGTGHDLPQDGVLLHQGTVMDGPFVWHIYA